MEFLQTLLAEQNERCAICDRHWSECEPAYKARTFLNHLCVDHDHRTIHIRGLLCNNCNTGLGVFEENYGRFLNAMSYLRRYTSIAIVLPVQTPLALDPAGDPG